MKVSFSAILVFAGGFVLVACAQEVPELAPQSSSAEANEPDLSFLDLDYDQDLAASEERLAAERAETERERAETAAITRVNDTLAGRRKQK